MKEFYAQEDVIHRAFHCASLQVYGVVGLQPLVDSPPTSRPKFARVLAVARVIFCRHQLFSILEEVNDGPLILFIAALTTECNKVNPSTGGSENSWTKICFVFLDCLFILTCFLVQWIAIHA